MTEIMDYLISQVNRGQQKFEITVSPNRQEAAKVRKSTGNLLTGDLALLQVYRQGPDVIYRESNRHVTFQGCIY